VSCRGFGVGSAPSRNLAEQPETNQEESLIRPSRPPDSFGARPSVASRCGIWFQEGGAGGRKRHEHTSWPTFILDGDEIVSLVKAERPFVLCVDNHADAPDVIGDVDNPTKRVQQQPLATSLPTRALVDRQTPDQGDSNGYRGSFVRNTAVA
jgi:hypothetical protein